MSFCLAVKEVAIIGWKFDGKTELKRLGRSLVSDYGRVNFPK